MENSQTRWAIAKGKQLDGSTISWTRKEAIEKFLKDCSYNWKYIKKFGWRAVKVKLMWNEN